MNETSTNEGSNTEETKLHEMSQEELLQSFVEIEINDSDDFLKIRETLTRMGVLNSQRNTLFQSCHILHKRGKYYILHFKELFGLDGKQAIMSREDYARRNTIAGVLEKWGMCQILNPDVCKEPQLIERNSLSIISFSDKNKYKLIPKYQIGKSNNNKNREAAENAE